MMSTQLNTEFDLDAFLGDLGLGDDADVKARFADEKVLTKLKESVLRQSDYDKKMNAAKAEVKAQQDELSQKQSSLNKLIELNTGYKGEAEKAVAKAIADKQKEVDAANAKLLKLAKEAGYEEDELEEIIPKTVKTKEKPVDEDELLKSLKGKGVVTADVLDRLATGHINLTLELDEVKETYEDLNNGKKMTRAQKDELLKAYNKDIATFFKDNPNASQPPPMMQTATRLLDFETKLEARAKTDREKLEAEIRADERRKMEAERMNDDLPGPRRTGIQSPLWNKTRKEGEKPTEGRGVRLAMEELAKIRAGQRPSA
jgi:chromosome segregation ATPase